MPWLHTMDVRATRFSRPLFSPAFISAAGQYEESVPVAAVEGRRQRLPNFRLSQVDSRYING